MTNDERIAIKLIFNTISDKHEHDLYEFHTKYRLSPSYITTAVSFLIEHNIATISEQKISLNNDIDNKKISIINRIYKTDKPSILLSIELDT